MPRSYGEQLNYIVFLSLDTLAFLCWMMHVLVHILFIVVTGKLDPYSFSVLISWHIGFLILKRSIIWNAKFSTWESSANIYGVSSWVETTFSSWEEMGSWASGNLISCCHHMFSFYFQAPDSAFLCFVSVASTSKRNNDRSAESSARIECLLEKDWSL